MVPVSDNCRGPGTCASLFCLPGKRLLDSCRNGFAFTTVMCISRNF